MRGSLLEVLTENERQANRSCAFAGLWTAAICLVIVAVGFTGAFYISGKWMLLYFAGMVLPIVVSARYLSRKFVWETYLAVVCLTALTTIPHAAFGLPISTIEKANIAKFSAFLSDGSFDRMAYWRGLLVWCIPSHTVCLGFFAIILSRLCRDGQEAITHQAKVDARLADVEKGLAIAATMEVLRDQGSGIRTRTHSALSTRHRALANRRSATGLRRRL